MKFTVDVDCTPEEARAFLGLPDVSHMQAAVVKQLQEKIESNINAVDAQKLFEMWIPTANNTAQAFQSFMQNIMPQTNTTKTSP